MAKRLRQFNLHASFAAEALAALAPYTFDLSSPTQVRGTLNVRPAAAAGNVHQSGSRASRAAKEAECIAAKPRPIELDITVT